MHAFNTPQDAITWRRSLNPQSSVGLVPTMGALHAGHTALIEQSAARDSHTIVSVFVNPLQFNNPEDLEKYPRRFEEDCAIAFENGADAVFTGGFDDFFPEGRDLVQPEAAGIYAQGLEGTMREGHFEGVRTIVRRLFEFIRPTSAYFGAKDFQQTLVIKDLARSLGFPQIIVVPTVREPSGLALSSRNERLTAHTRALATKISQALYAARDEFQRGTRDVATLEAVMHQVMAHPEIMIEYATVRDPNHWSVDNPAQLAEHAQALIAVQIDGVRLIDNLPLNLAS